MTRISVYVGSVNIELAEIDTKVLADELKRRGKEVPAFENKTRTNQKVAVMVVPPIHGEETHPLHEIYFAIKFGRDEAALALTRAYINDIFGTAL